MYVDIIHKITQSFRQPYEPHYRHCHWSRYCEIAWGTSVGYGKRENKRKTWGVPPLSVRSSIPFSLSQSMRASPLDPPNPHPGSQFWVWGYWGLKSGNLKLTPWCFKFWSSSQIYLLSFTFPSPRMPFPCILSGLHSCIRWVRQGRMCPFHLPITRASSMIIFYFKSAPERNFKVTLSNTGFQV